MSSERVLMRGSNALGEAAVRAGCRYYFGYPITPQNEVPEYLSGRLPQVGGTFIQAESEIGSINMVLGASSAGGRVMTSSSSPGLSLMQEGISYMAGMELPAVLVNMMRGGPGLGNIAPSQADYFQATRGGGNGDYRTPVFAPAGVQELVNLTAVAFDTADAYRTPVMILGDGLIGQMMEPVVMPEFRSLESLPAKPWAMTGCAGRGTNSMYSLILDPPKLHQHNFKLQEKYDRITAKEIRWDTYLVDDAELVVVAYGTSSRVAKGAINKMRKEGKKVGLFRPITLWPYPYKALRALTDKVKSFAVFEMSMGQMVEDVMLAVAERAEVFFHGVPGGVVPSPADAAAYLESVLKNDGRVGRRVQI